MVFFGPDIPGSEGQGAGGRPPASCRPGSGVIMFGIILICVVFSLPTLAVLLADTELGRKAGVIEVERSILHVPGVERPAPFR